MKIKDATFIQRHVEKMALGTAGVFLLLVTAYYLFPSSKPFGVVLGVKEGRKNIGDVGPMMTDLSKTLKKAILKKSQINPDDFYPPNYPQILRDLHDVPVTHGVLLPQWGNHPLDVKVMTIIPTSNQAYYRPRPPAPLGGRVLTGNVVLASGEDRTYVSLDATFDQDAWSKRMQDAAKKHTSSEEVLIAPMVAQGLNLAGVYLEREQWDAARRAWAGRQAIVLDGQVCYREDQPGFDANIEKERANSVLKSIKDNQSVIRNPGFPPLDKGSPVPVLVQEKNAEMAKENPAAFPVPSSEVKESILPALRVWAHDLSVQPNQKYRYRLVVNVVNPLYGVSAASLNEDQAKKNATQIALAPEPRELESTPWVPVTISPNFCCFFVDAPNNLAQFEVWKIVGGNWVMQAFDVKPGDAVGNANALVQFSSGETKPVNLDSHYVLMDVMEIPDPTRPERKVKAALLMNAGGQLEVRYSSVDANSIERMQLLDKLREVAAPANGGAAPAPR